MPFLNNKSLKKQINYMLKLFQFYILLFEQSKQEKNTTNNKTGAQNKSNKYIMHITSLSKGQRK
jgi:hypothetical protein